MSRSIKDFMGKPAPPGYVPGLGRGAAGFTTRSDIGPAREGSSATATPAATTGEQEDPDQYQDPENETGLFNGVPYDEEDEEADAIYSEVDKVMEERRQSRKEEREREDIAKYRKERPKVQEQFSDLKRGLADVTDEQWDALPEVGDLVGKNRKKARVRERFSSVPDSLLERGREQLGHAQQETDVGKDAHGLATPMALASGTMTNFAEIGEARDKVLGLKLDQITDSASGQTTVDPMGYLTDLGSVMIKSDAEIGDIKKARMLLSSVTTTNPKHAPGWIAAARLEEVAGKMAKARALISKGCDLCPTKEDVWLEAARLYGGDNSRKILGEAVKHVPQSVRVWLEAVGMEGTVEGKKRVLQRALEYIPTSVRLWKGLISLEKDPAEVRVLLARAVELIPLHVEFWLALARVETYERARKVLNRARTSVPSSHEVWVAAAQLEEANNPEGADRVEKIVHRAVQALAQRGSILRREGWLEEAEKCEEQGSPLTMQAIVNATIGMGVEEEDRKGTWVEDAEGCITREHYQTARAIYAHALKVFPAKKGLWLHAVTLEREHGTREALDEVLASAVKFCPHAEILWLVRAKEKWQGGDVAGAREVLRGASARNPESERVWLAAVKLENETGHREEAMALLAEARQQANTARVWMVSAILERQEGRQEEALEILESAILRFPSLDKLYMIQGQILLGKGDVAGARAAYARGCKACPHSGTLWVLAARLEEEAGLVIKARVALERGRLLNPGDEGVWREAVGVEGRAGNAHVAKTLMAKALQECPTSGALWSDAILMEPRPSRRARSVDALRKCDVSGRVVSTVARLFWAERKVDKARGWFGRAIKLEPLLGDAWAWWLRFERQHGTEAEQEAVVAACVAAEPRYGDVWPRVAKSPANVGKGTRAILMMVADELGGA